jgi:Flp pilus assembly protein TadB
VFAALLLALVVTITTTANPGRAEDRSAATTVGDMAQAGTSTVRPPDPPKRAEAGAGQGAAISIRAERDDATTAPQDTGSGQDELPAQWSAAASGETVDVATITLACMFLFIAGGLVVAAIVLRTMIKAATKRQSSRRQFEADLATVIAAARRAAPPLPPHAPSDYAGTQTRPSQQPAAGTVANRQDE